MAAYVFETMTQEQAAQFNTENGDILVFSNQTSSATNVMARQSEASGLNLAGIILSAGGKSLTFPADEISAASQDDRIQFADNSRLLLGTGDDTAVDTLEGESTSTDVAYGFQGDDVLTGGDVAGSSDDRPDFLYGGIGNDDITGSGSNDRLYGNDPQNNRPNGRDDGDDTIAGGLGGDYIQGNQGDDSLDGGADSDVIFGGQGDDTILGGAAEGGEGAFGVDRINGNIGQDDIDGGDGNDFLRGGRDDDTVDGGEDDDTISGDAGDDTIIGGLGFDILTGDSSTVMGADAGGDTFTFDTEDAQFTTQGEDADLMDVITDFQLGDDTLDLTGDFADVTTGDEDVSFDSVYQARIYAEGLLSEGDTDRGATLAAVQVGSDTILFFASDGTSDIDSAIRLTGLDVNEVDEDSLGLVGDMTVVP